MNKSVIWFVLGLAVGAVGGILGTKSHFKKEAEEYAEAQTEGIRKFYESKTRTSYAGTETEEAPKKEEDNRSNQEKKQEIREKLQRNWKETTDYASMYQTKEEENDAVDQAVTAIEEMERMEEESNKNHDRAPRIISYEQVQDLDTRFDYQVLYFYSQNEVVVAEEGEEVIDDPGRILGDCLTKYDFAHSKEQIIWVLNYELDVVYEIQKLEGVYYQM